MQKIADYNIIEALEKSSYLRSYRARKEGAHETRVITLISTEQASPSQIARARQEYETITALSLPGIVAVEEIRIIPGNLMVIQEDFRGKTLKSILKDGCLDMVPFLKIGITIAETLGQLHQEGIVHNAVGSENVLIRSADQTVKLANFSQLNLLGTEGESLFSNQELQKMLPYISPERSGRVSRPVDYRSDLYSTGVVFYEMLSGSPPFQFNDPLELIYAHIARKPIPLTEIRKDIPSVVSDMVMKLLSKSVEERYQSGFGLMADLQECHHRLQHTGKILFFKPAQNDLPIMFKTPERLFGRETEQAELGAMMARVRQGERIVSLVSGQAGIGKSSLIQELHRPVAGCNGHFISGKFEQLNPDTPYHAIFQALQRLVRQILSQSKEKIAHWKAELLAALGSNAGIITDILPEVVLIIGNQPQVPPLGPEESQNRFQHVMKNFITVFAAMDHPLVLFLDDLQWSDSASLGLLTSILGDPDTKHFLFIGAFRDGEIAAKHPLMEARKELARSGIDVRELSLAPLKVMHVNQFLMDCLHCVPERSLPLAELVHRKTDGNPFFIKQFMETVHEIGLIKLDPATGWQWDVDEIEGIEETRNVSALMAGKITRLPQRAQELLKICACFGSRFNPESISEFVERPIDDTVFDLREAIREGLIIASNRYFKFAHDRIQESVYRLIPESIRKETHLRIGRFEFVKKKHGDLTDNIFFTVNQLNLAKELLVTDSEKDELAERNLLAGKAAKSTTAYSLAFTYLKTGVDLMGTAGWERNYSLTLSLYTEAVEAAYLTTAFDEMEKLAEQVDLHSRSPLDKVPIHTVGIKTLLARNRLLPAVESGLHILDQLGVHFPEKPKMIHLLSGLLKTKWRLLGKPVETLVNLPQMESDLVIAQIQIMSTMSTAVYWAAPNLLPLMVFQMVRLGVKFGHTPLAPYNYAGYGLILCGIGEIETGYRFGKMALQLMEIMNVREQKAKTLFVFNTFIRHWKEHVRNSLKPLVSAYQCGVETGDFEFAAFALQIYCFHSFCANQPLNQLEAEMREYIDVIKSLKQSPQLNMTRLHHQVVLNLRDAPENPWLLAGESYREQEMLPLHQDAGDRTILFTLYYYKLMLCYLFGKHESALENARKAEERIDAVVSSYILVGFYFYDALNRLAMYEDASPRRKRNIIRKVRKNRKKLYQWSRHAPMNCQHHCELLEAELLHVQGNAEAGEAYEQAIRHANVNGFWLEEALANELAARHYVERNRANMARYYRNEACRVYGLWGARSKVAALGEVPPKDSTLGVADGRLSLHGQLDHTTVVHSLQAISTEIILRDLLARLTKIIAENAGADKVLFISVTGDQLSVAAEWSENSSGTDETAAHMQAVPVDRRSDLLVPVVNYVKRTKEYVVLDDAQKQGDYTNESYVRQHALKSVLCLPVIRQSNLTGILYLENTAAPGVFTLARIEILQLLASQAAISLENAALYENLATASQALIESEKKYRLLAENVSDNIWIFDLEQMKFTYQSPSILQIRGYTPEEAMQQSLEDILPPDSLRIAMENLEEEIALEALGTADPARTRSMEIENRRKDGSVIWTEAIMRFLRDDQGRAVSILGATRDITTRKKAEEEIRKLNVELEQRVVERTAELQKSLETLRNTQEQLVQTEKMAALGGLVAGVAHEINTPLGIGLMASSLLEEKTKSGNQAFAQGKLTRTDLDNYFKIAAESSRLIYNNLQKAADLVSSFKQVVSEQTGEQCRWIILKDYIDELLIGLQPKVQGSGHAIRIHCPDDLKLYGDPGYLYKIFTNLILNSILHGFENVQKGEIEIDIWKEAEWIVIVYKDNGKGMDSETLQKMCDPFFTTKRARGGTGLGMHILYNLVSQALGGTMECTSKVNEGVVFLIRIPVAPNRVSTKDPAARFL